MKLTNPFIIILFMGISLFAREYQDKWGNYYSVEMPEPLPIDFIINTSQQNLNRSQSDTVCESCNINDYDPTLLGGACCDHMYELTLGSTLYPDGITCIELENIYGWNCSGCTCPADILLEENIGCTEITNNDIFLSLFLSLYIYVYIYIMLIRKIC